MKHCCILFYTSRIRSFRRQDSKNNEPAKSKDGQDEQDLLLDEILKSKKVNSGAGNSFLAKLAIVVGIAATITIISVSLKPSSLGSSFGVQRLAEGSSSSLAMASPAGFSFNAFGYKFVLPEYAPGYAPSLLYSR